MNSNAAKLFVLVGEQFACVKIVGRANFASSIDFKTLIHGLRQKGYRYFVLELSECVLMDSTFLGVLAGFGLKLERNPQGEPAIELLNPNPRVTELLENLGVLHLFKLNQGCLPVESDQQEIHTATDAPREEVTKACLEAHETLMALNPENASKFKEVTQFLTEDLKKLRAAQ